MPLIPGGQIQDGSISGGKIAVAAILANIGDITFVNSARLTLYGQNGDLLIYDGEPATGNLIGSWSPDGGVDDFGNAYPRGLDTFTASIIAQSVNSSTITVQDGPVLNYGSGQIVQQLTGSSNWTAPAGVTSVQVFAIAAGGGGADSTGPGGGGGEFAYDVLTVTPASLYAYSVGAAGAGPLGNGADTTFGPDDNRLTVTANGGTGGGFAGGTGGTGSANSVHFNGGTGGNAGASTGGGGGGGAAGSNGPGSAGTTNTGTSGVAGGPGGGGFFPGGAGGRGGGNATPGSTGVAPGGGGGGDGAGNSTTVSGAAGTLWLLYTPSVNEQLINSIAPVAGTDPATGDTYQPGIVNYNPTLTTYAQLNSGILTLSAGVGTVTHQLATSGFPISAVSIDGNTYGLGRIVTVVTSNQTVTSANPTLAPISGLSSVPLAASRNYLVRGRLYITPASNSGTGQFGWATGTTFTSFTMAIKEFRAPLNSSPAIAFGDMTIMNAKGSLFGTATFGTSSIVLDIDGALICNAANSIQLQACYLTTQFTVLAGSYLEYIPIP